MKQRICLGIPHERRGRRDLTPLIDKYPLLRRICRIPASTDDRSMRRALQPVLVKEGAKRQGRWGNEITGDKDKVLRNAGGKVSEKLSGADG
jgi:hypothetical protein